MYKSGGFSRTQEFRYNALMGTPAGGPSTIHGIWYQMLRSLLHTCTLRIRHIDCDDSSSGVSSATVVLEPLGTGGDLHIDAETIIVEQVKLRSGGRTWSLAEIIRDVIPDLYSAAREHGDNATYRFVTDGRRGEWSHALDYLRSFRDRQMPASGLLDTLDWSAFENLIHVV